MLRKTVDSVCFDAATRLALLELPLHKDDHHLGAGLPPPPLLLLHLLLPHCGMPTLLPPLQADVN